MSDIVYTRQSGVLAHGGQRIRVTPGEPWRADDPLVAAYPDFFVDHVPAVRTTEDPRGWTEYTPPGKGMTADVVIVDELPVERATAAPGERRQTRRPSRKDGGADA